MSDDKLLAKPQPTCPEAAKAKGISGSVFIRLMADTDGNVISATISSGPPLLQEAALDVAKHARLRPTKLSGQPVKVTGLLRYDFILDRNSH